MVTATFLISAFSLMLVGIFGMLTRKNIIRILLAVNILETGVNLLLVALGYFPGGKAPIITQAVSASNLPFVDPLPQALVLTSIVIGLGTTALALAITLRYYRRRRSLEFETDEEDLSVAAAALTVNGKAAPSQSAAAHGQAATYRSQTDGGPDREPVGTKEHRL